MRINQKIIIIYIIFLGSFQILSCVETEKKIITSVHFNVGYPAAYNSSTEFFKTYKNELYGLQDGFTHPAIAGISIKIKYPENIRFGLDAHYQHLDMKDHYQEEVNYGYKTRIRQISQDLTLTTRAVYAIIEYIPIVSQFRTYAGAGLGANFGTIFWTEKINSNIRNDIRTGGNHVDKLQVSPSVKLYTGLELGFDKENIDDYLGSIFFEIMYINLFRQQDILSDVYDQLDDPDDSILESYNLASAYVSFNFGVSFNLDIFKLNQVKN